MLNKFFFILILKNIDTENYIYFNRGNSLGNGNIPVRATMQLAYQQKSTVDNLMVEFYRIFPLI